MTSYLYRKSHCGDKTILRPSYLHNGISCTGNTTSLYWIGALNISNLSRDEHNWFVHPSQPHQLNPLPQQTVGTAAVNGTGYRQVHRLEKPLAFGNRIPKCVFFIMVKVCYHSTFLMTKGEGTTKGSTGHQAILEKLRIYFALIMSQSYQYHINQSFFMVKREALAR